MMTNLKDRLGSAASLIVALTTAIAFVPAFQSAAQSQPECEGRPPDNLSAPLSCQKSTGSEKIQIDTDSLEIATTTESAVSAVHEGTGGIEIELRNSKLTTQSDANQSTINAHGVNSETASGPNSVMLNNVDIRILGTGTVGQVPGSVGVRARRNSGAGALHVDLTRSRVETHEEEGHGIEAYAVAGSGNLSIAVRDSFIKAHGGPFAIGIYGYSSGSGDIAIDASSSTIQTVGDSSSHAIAGIQRGANGGKIEIVATGTTIMVAGKDSRGIYARRARSTKDADISIRLSGSRISSTRIGTSSDEKIRSQAVRAEQNGTGDAIVDMRGGTLSTKGELSHGIFASHTSPTTTESKNLTGNLVVTVRGGADISTSGVLAHGILGMHYSTNDDRAMVVQVDRANVTASGAGGRGISLGSVSTAENPGLAGLSEGYRRHSVLINGRVWGGTGSRAAGVFLAGGGRVTVGPFGIIGADSRAAILAERISADPNLQVRLNPGGRRMSDVLGNNWIINDGGKTEIVMNGVLLHDANEGASTNIAPNGAYDVSLRPDGYNFQYSSNPQSIEELASGTTEDRDFSAQDFIEVYAPRAAVYESLPAALMQIDGGVFGIGFGQGRALAFGDFAASTTSESGSGKTMLGPAEAGAAVVEPLLRGYLRSESSRTSRSQKTDTGASYRLKRWHVEAGMEMLQSDNLVFSGGVRRVVGNTDVIAPGGGGKIDSRGFGATGSVTWRTSEGIYAAGHLSSTRYDVSVASETRGVLAPDLAATVLNFGAEIGKIWSFGNGSDLIARAWAGHSRVKIDEFIDRTGTRVATPRSVTRLAGIGVAGRQLLTLGEAGTPVTMSGSFGIETISGDGTEVHVSGTSLKVAPPNGARITVGVGIEQKFGDFSVGGQIRAVRHGSSEKSLALSMGATLAF